MFFLDFECSLLDYQLTEIFLLDNHVMNYLSEFVIQMIEIILQT